MKAKKSASNIIAYFLLFTITFTIFLSTYYYFYPLIEKTQSKSELQSIEKNVIELSKKLSITLNSKVSQTIQFPITKGTLTLDKSVFGFNYNVQLPYSPYPYNWFNLLTKKLANLDICEISNVGGRENLVNCLAESAKCDDLPNTKGMKVCVFPQLNNVTILYIKASGKEFKRLDPNKFYYVSKKPIFKLVKNDEICSIYVRARYGKLDNIDYYVVCNIKRVGETCYIPYLKGNVVSRPVSNRILIFNYLGDKYIPRFNYFGCSDAYLRMIEVKMK